MRTGAPFLSRTSRRIGAPAATPSGAAGPPENPVQRWSLSINREQVVQLSPGVRDTGSASIRTLSASPQSFGSNFAGSVLLAIVTADTATYATSFNATALTRTARIMPAAPASYAATFTASTNLVFTRRLFATPTTLFAASFGAAAISRGRTVVAVPASFAQPWNVAGLTRGRRLVAAPTPFSIAFTVAGLVKGGQKLLTANAASFAATFVATTTFTASRRLLAQLATYGSTHTGALLSAGLPVVPPRTSPEADLLAFLRARLTAPVVLNAADEGMRAPYVVMTSSHDPTYGLFGPVLEDHVTFNLACWAPTALEAELVADEIQTLLEDHVDDLYVLGREGGFDHATTMDVSVLTVDRWV